MIIRHMPIVACGLMALAILAVTPCGAQVLTREPPLGQLKEGERVLVDDGTCPRGQIKEVIGGNHVIVGGSKRIERTRRCISRR